MWQRGGAPGAPECAPRTPGVRCPAPRRGPAGPAHATHQAHGAGLDRRRPVVPALRQQIGEAGSGQGWRERCGQCGRLTLPPHGLPRAAPSPAQTRCCSRQWPPQCRSSRACRGSSSGPRGGRPAAVGGRGGCWVASGSCRRRRPGEGARDRPQTAAAAMSLRGGRPAAGRRQATTGERAGATHPGGGAAQQGAEHEDGRGTHDRGSACRRGRRGSG